MERVVGIEPTSSAWKAEVLPLNYTRQMPPPRARRNLTPVPSAGIRTTDFACSLRFPRGGGGRIRTFEGVSRQIYSLLPLTAWVPHREKRAAYSDFGSDRCQFDLARVLLAWRGFFAPHRQLSTVAARPHLCHTSIYRGQAPYERAGPVPRIRAAGVPAAACAECRPSG
jgi:hypothetical protein